MNGIIPIDATSWARYEFEDDLTPEELDTFRRELRQDLAAKVKAVAEANGARFESETVYDATEETLSKCDDVVDLWTPSAELIERWRIIASEKMTIQVHWALGLLRAWRGDHLAGSTSFDLEDASISRVDDVAMDAFYPWALGDLMEDAGKHVSVFEARKY